MHYRFGSSSVCRYHPQSSFQSINLVSISNLKKLIIKNIKATILKDNHFLCPLMVVLFFFYYFSVSTQAENRNLDSFEEDPAVILAGEAEEALAHNDYDTAILRLKEAISIHPFSESNTLLFLNLSKIYCLIDSDSVALSIVEDIIHDFPRMKNARIHRANVLLKLRRDKDAYYEFDNVLKLDSLDATARYYHGLMALYNGNMDIAEKDMNILKTVAPDAIETSAALASLYSMTGRDAEAIPFYKILIEKDGSPEYFAALAGCYLQLGQLSDASAVLSEAMSKYPLDAELYYYRAWLNRDRYRLDDARKDARKAIELGANPKKVSGLGIK